jgi:oligoribonuclease (3'-5' exoribonuclease)
MSKNHPPDWSIDVAMKIWRKFGPHIIDSKKVVEMAWIVADVVLDKPAHQMSDLAVEVRDKQLLDMLERKHRSAMLVGFVAMLPQSPECNLRELLTRKIMEGKPQ